MMGCTLLSGCKDLLPAQVLVFFNSFVSLNEENALVVIAVCGNRRCAHRAVHPILDHYLSDRSVPGNAFMMHVKPVMHAM